MKNECKGFMSSFDETFKEQNALLEVLGDSVTRQMHMAKNIGQETEEQLELLDRIEGSVQTSTLRVEREAARIEKFSWKSSTGALWVVVLLLLVALCVLIVLAVYLPKKAPDASTTTLGASTTAANATQGPT